MIAPSWLSVLDDTIGACTTHHRPDLAHRLRRTRARLLDPRLRVLVVGTLNQGKSQLINALVNAPVCAVGDDLTTTAPTVVAHSDVPSAALVTEPAADARRAIAGPARVDVPIDEVTRQVTRAAGTDDALGNVVRAEIGIPRKLLAAGLVLVDTPAAGPDVTRTVAAAEQADAVLFASSATAELTGAEVDLLVRITAACPNIIVALTKIDLVPRWRAVAERDRTLLGAARVPARVVPISAALRLAAARQGDTAINTESGFPELIGLLHRQVATKADQVAPRVAGVVAAATLAELATRVRTSLAAPPALRVPDTDAQLLDAQRAMDELRRRTARCQTVLADQMADLGADVEHDLRDRTRKILREVDRVFDDADPGTAWAEFADWLRASLIETAEANLGWLAARCQWVADRALAAFPPEPGDRDAPRVPSDAADPVAEIGEMDTPRLDRFTHGQKIFTGLRGSYGGVLMFGLITSLAGLPLINPISLGAGAAFGGKSIMDEGESRLKRRQAAAKAAAQRHIDDFFLTCSKESREITRQVHRGLRDHVTERSDELAGRIAEGSREAQRTAQVAAAERERYRQELAADLERLVGLHRRAIMLAAHRDIADAAGVAGNGGRHGERRGGGLELTA